MSGVLPIFTARVPDGERFAEVTFLSMLMTLGKLRIQLESDSSALLVMK